MSKLEFPHPAPTEIGVRQPLLPGLDCVRLSLPFALDHVNCWWLHDKNSTCLIDTGVSSKKTRSIWDSFFLDNPVPDQLLVTHYHPDHTGLAGWFSDKGVALISSEIEQQHSKNLFCASDEAYALGFHDWYVQNGMSAEQSAGVWTRGNGYKKLVFAEPELNDFAFVKAGDTLSLANREFTVMVGQGHAPAMLMLYCERDGFLIAADQCLPTISPNVSLMPASLEFDPLDGFLTTLASLKALPADTLVLPSHGEPFIGLHTRIDQLSAHHEERLALLLENLQKPAQAVSLFPVLFKRELDDLQLGFALGETLAHLRCLSVRGEVRIDAYNGGDWYQLS